MSSHEINAIHFHTEHPATGDAPRRGSEKALRQHGTSPGEFPPGGSNPGWGGPDAEACSNSRRSADH
jgi:hypothetical protein